MDRKDTISILAIMKAAYPSFYKGISKQEAEEIINLWCDMFNNEPVGIVGAAVKSLIETDEKGYPPHIGAVKEKIRLITCKEEKTEMEAWNLVFKAICRGIYHSKEDFEKFPDEIKEIVGSYEQIKHWAMMDSSEVQSVVSSNFQRSYREKMKRKNEFEKLPDDVKKIAKTMSNNLMLEGCKE